MLPLLRANRKQANLSIIQAINLSTQAHRSAIQANQAQLRQTELLFRLGVRFDQ